MLRAFTRPVGRFTAGEQRDYSRSVWEAIARSAKLPLDKFSIPVTDEVLRELVAPKKK
jgi:hypothetical protein